MLLTAHNSQQKEIIGFGGFVSIRNVQQMAAYRLALEERTGYHCDVALIIVSTPETTQGIFIDGDQMDLYESRFLKRCQMFHDMESNNNEVEDCSSQEVQEQNEPAESSEGLV